MAHFDEPVTYNKGEVVSVAAHDVTLADVVSYIGGKGVSLADVTLTPSCSCDGDCCNTPYQYIELTWKVKP